MGWTSMRKPHNIKEYLTEGWGDKYKVLDVAIVAFSTAYLAVKQLETGQVFCGVFLLRFGKEPAFDFHYKDMTEFMGPCEHNCPERILKQLTPLDDTTDPNGYAREWRKKAWNLINLRKQIKEGVIIVTDREINFTSNIKRNKFIRVGKRWMGIVKDGDQYKKDYQYYNFNPFRFGFIVTSEIKIA